MFANFAQRNIQSVWGRARSAHGACDFLLLCTYQVRSIVHRTNSSVQALSHDLSVSQWSMFVLNMQGNLRINCSFAKISKLIQDTDTAVFKRSKSEVQRIFGDFVIVLGV